MIMNRVWFNSSAQLLSRALRSGGAFFFETLDAGFENAIATDGLHCEFQSVISDAVALLEQTARSRHHKSRDGVIAVRLRQREIKLTIRVSN